MQNGCKAAIEGGDASGSYRADLIFKGASLETRRVGFWETDGTDKDSYEVAVYNPKPGLAKRERN